MVGRWWPRHYTTCSSKCPEFHFCKRQVAFGVQMGIIPDRIQRRNISRGQLSSHRPQTCLAVCSVSPSCFSRASSPCLWAVLLCRRLRSHFIKLSLGATKDVVLLAENEEVKPHWILELFGGARHRALGHLPGHWFIFNGPG